MNTTITMVIIFIYIYLSLPLSYILNGLPYAINERNMRLLGKIIAHILTFIAFPFAYVIVFVRWLFKKKEEE